MKRNTKNTKRGRRTTTILLILVFIVGLSLLLYPTVSDWWNSFHATRAIASYQEAVDNMDEDVYQEVWDSAVAYNEEIAQHGIHWVLSDEEIQDYESQLDVGGTGIMGYIEIPRIDCELPIYHGTAAEVLQIAVGHIEGSSLPVGGESTHCVLSGHRGLPSAKLFSDLDEMEEEDIFILHTLNETLTYEVDQIRIVLPNELSDLELVEGEDLCTLVTCTPYGVNTHRLLVRGHRVENRYDTLVSMEAVQIEPMIVASVIAVPILLALLIWLLVSTGKKRKKGSRRAESKKGRMTEDKNDGITGAEEDVTAEDRGK